MDCKYTRRQRQIYAPLVSSRRWHFGYAFLIAVTTTPRHHSLLHSHSQSEDIGQSTHWHLLTHCSHSRAPCHPKRVHSESFSSGRVTRHITAFSVHISLPAHITARCSISLFGVVLRYLSVVRWKNSRICGSLTAPHG